MNNGLKSLIKSLLPPALLHSYRKVRYSQYDDAAAASDRAQAAQSVLPTRTLLELFPGIDTVNITLPATEINRPRDMVVPLAELLTLGAICRHLQPQRIFEIGTYTGSSTLVMAMNTAEDTELTTLDYDTSAIVGSAYRGAAQASRIKQLHGDSRAYDYSPYFGANELVLVDANHTYEFVKTDTETAFRLLRPGGVIVWDDYRWLDTHSECMGVTRCLNELQQTRPVFQIAGTRFAVYLDHTSGRDEQT